MTWRVVASLSASVRRQPTTGAEPLGVGRGSASPEGEDRIGRHERGLGSCRAACSTLEWQWVPLTTNPLLVSFLSWVGSFSVAAAQMGPEPEVDSCLRAHERAQLTRDQGDLLATREALRECAEESCPHLVRRDCVTLLAEVNRTLPSVVVDVTIAGESKPPEQLWIDGQEVPFPTEAIELNPGLHTFRAVHEIDGERVEEEIELVLQPSVRRQLARLSLAPPIDETTLPPAGGPGRPEAPPPADEGRKLRIAGYSLLGLGAAAGAATIAMGVTGFLARNDLDGECAPFCDHDRVVDIRNRFIVADVLGAVTGALLVSSAVLITIGIKRNGLRDRKVSAFVGPASAGLRVRW